MTAARWSGSRTPTQDWTVERLTEKHSSRPYNPDVANAFFRAGMIEAWGRGIERIMEACRAAGVPVPELRYEHSGLWVEFAFRVTEENAGETPEKTREKILDLISANPAITTEELASQTGITRKGIEWQISKLKQTGYLERSGPAKAATGMW